MNSRIQFIEAQEKLARADLAEAEGLRDDASLKVIELERAKAAQRDVLQARAELATLEAEVHECLKQIARLKGAKKQAAVQDTREFKLAVRAYIGGLQTKVDERLQRMEELEIDIVRTLWAIAPKLGELSRLGDQNHEDTWAIAKAAVGAKEAQGHMGLISHVVRGASLAPNFAAALDGSGLLARLRGYVEVRYLGTASQFAYERANAQHVLAGLVARYDEELRNGKKPAAPLVTQVSRRGADLAGMAELRAKGEA